MEGMEDAAAQVSSLLQCIDVHDANADDAELTMLMMLLRQPHTHHSELVPVVFGVSGAV